MGQADSESKGKEGGRGGSEGGGENEASENEMGFGPAAWTGIRVIIESSDSEHCDALQHFWIRQPCKKALNLKTHFRISVSNQNLFENDKQKKWDTNDFFQDINRNFNTFVTPRPMSGLNMIADSRKLANSCTCVHVKLPPGKYSRVAISTSFYNCDPDK